ncbi:uncharacterized protein BXZ73DRAFT_74628 [Epithele typhae]|uniref:uncharacterized protein n=1 Tax=Epithele typhae TaxID=378194 RepID=UPI00200802F0|nr:uncharacterized protein BXZ73DRAFT_74628 [Epithele typhae]KAH9942355.1 hypothetical protein BXZ73DRAFT_74628 [Epithele typhae]
MRSSRSRDAPTRSKALLTLKLSGSSFLDTVIRDDRTKDPLYILETSNDLTTIYRLDHPRDEPIKAATVQWPLHPVRVKGKSGRTVQIGGGSWREAEEFLKSGPLGNTAVRKFSLPHYPNSLKWKLIPGNCFCCVTNPVKGPVAVLDAATLSAPPRIKIFDTLIDKDVARSQDNYKGIPTLLLDYLIVTAFILVTDVQEWLDRPRDSRIPGGSSYTVQRWLALIHNRPPPPEPEHPTVDLSLTVPSTPPHSATFPSPGGLWETQSGVTSLSGSNGSGSGASYIQDPFSPTTPGTPATPATSTHSSAFFSRGIEEPPPVPPVPGSSSGASPFAYNAQSSSQARERPKSGPQTSSHAPSSSTSKRHTARHPYGVTEDGEDSTPSPRPRPSQTLSLPPGSTIAASLSTSAPPTPLPPPPTAQSTSSNSSTSSRPARRLPTPPGPAPEHSFAQPWLNPSTPTASSSSSSALPPAPSASTSSPGSSNPNARAARASMRGALRNHIPPPAPPPPQHTLPLPPKLAQEQQGHAPSQPAPDYDTHSFVNMAPPSVPPVPAPTGASPGASGGLRSPSTGRRVLAVVNIDVQSQEGLPERNMRVRGRISYAESVYEAPPPAYDAIDFSVPPVPSVPHMHSLSRMASHPHLSVAQPMSHPAPGAITPLPVPPTDPGGEGQRAS